MKKTVYLLLAATIVCACNKKDDHPSGPPAILRIAGLPADTIFSLNENYTLQAEMGGDAQAKYEWMADDKKISDQPSVIFKPTRAGQYTLTLKAENPLGATQESFKIEVFRPVNKSSSKWISRIVDYRPAPGQFVNTTTGDLAAAEGVVGKRGLVSLGAWGGYIEFGFDHTVINGKGNDFVIHGNAFEGSSEAGVVMVACDANGNGKADADEWFELKGSVYDRSRRGCTITYTRPQRTDAAQDVEWQDDKAVAGRVEANGYHTQCYYPLFLADNPASLTFRGSMLPGNASQSEDGIWSLSTFAWGYADNASPDYSTVLGGDRDTANSNKFDIDNAVDANGRPVRLKGVDFIRVSSGLCQQAGWIGESSTEVAGAISLSAIAVQ